MVAAAAAQGGDGGFDISDASTSQATTANAPPPSSLGEVTIGVTGLSGASDVFGRYNGMTKNGPGATASFNLRQRDPWDSGGTHYFNFTGNNVTFGLGASAPEANLTAKTGEQGVWSLGASYDAMTYTASDHFTSILTPSGTLTPGYQNALASANMFFSGVASNPSTLFGAFNASTGLATANPISTLGAANQVLFNIGTRRDKGTLEGSLELSDWLFTSAVSHEHKEGSLEEAMTTGGNNAGMTTFPMPINYDTDSFTASGAYTTDNLQARISYEFSDFIDHNPNGYAFQGWNFAAFKSPAPVTFTSFAKSGDYALPPSNQAHTITGEVGYNIDDTTRVYATAVLGLQMQNAAFVPATSLGYFKLAVAAPLAAQLASNPGSLDGYVDTGFANVTLTSRPMTDLDLTASYKIDTRDPHTKAMAIYGDPTDTTALKLRQAVPESWTKQDLTLQAGYRVLPETRITAGYAYRQQHRGNAITHDTSDNEFSASLHSMLTDTFTGTLNYLHAERTASAPDWSLWLVQIPSDCGSTLAALGCQQVPFYEAARTQDSINGNLSGMLDNDTSISIFGKYNADTYHSPSAAFNNVTTKSVGLNRDYSVDAGPDLNYRVNKDASLHFYYTFERAYRDMRALNNQSVAGGLPYYRVASTYDIHTGGAGGTWQVDEQWKLVGDYTLSYGGEHFAQSGNWNSGFPGDPILDTKSLIHQLKLHADYQYSERTSYYFGYEFDSLDNTDWALVGATVGQVLTGDVPAKYNVSKIMVAMTMKL
jgi:MtrB/PioB family decaheme-associated outer membrane protein